MMNLYHLNYAQSGFSIEMCQVCCLVKKIYVFFGKIDPNNVTNGQNTNLFADIV